MSATKFCAYCRMTKPYIGFKVVIHPGTGSRRYQCPTCQEVRKKSTPELEQLAKAEAQQRRKARAELLQKLKEERLRSD